MRSRVPRALLVLSLLIAPLAQGQEVIERRDHRGSLGLLVAATGERVDHAATGYSNAGWRAGAEAGGTLQFGQNDNEVALRGRLIFGGPALDVLIRAGLRRFFGLEAWKTFVELDVVSHVTPRFSIGPGIGAGVQYDFASIAGVYAVVSTHLGFGSGIRFGADVLVGLQLRTYLFESFF